MEQTIECLDQDYGDFALPILLILMRFGTQKKSAGYRELLKFDVLLDV